MIKAIRFKIYNEWTKYFEPDEAQRVVKDFENIEAVEFKEQMTLQEARSIFKNL